jgi:hypothetical protein
MTDAEDKQTWIKATVIDTAWIAEDKNWRVTLHSKKGKTFTRFFYNAHPPALNDEIEIRV